jgi:hypothetical protein
VGDGIVIVSCQRIAPAAEADRSFDVIVAYPGRDVFTASRTLRMQQAGISTSR